jgi:3-hydroxybutyryl-CoA dehydrogenase
MGRGIAYVAALGGYETRLMDSSRAQLDKAIAEIGAILEKGVATGKVADADAIAAHKRLAGVTTVEDAARDADLVIEAVPEKIELKVELFAQLDRLAPAHAILASNTSSLSITEMAAFTKRADRFVGLHFFNPVPLMKLVEVVRSPLTSSAAFEEAYAFAQSLGKQPIKAADKTGFIVNRLLVPYLLDAIRVYESGLASLEDIDTAMKLGCGYPMGPFTLLDLVGLDTTMYVAEVMFEEFREARYAPPPLLKRMVMAGQLGRKTGKGFYTYPAK